MRELEMKVGEKEKGEKMEVMQLERDIAVLSNVVMLAENLMKKGNEEIDVILHGKVLNRKALTTANNKVTLGRKRKEELEKELQLRGVKTF